MSTSIFNSTNSEIGCEVTNWDEPAATCHVLGFTSVVGGKWKLPILCVLDNEGPVRFNALVDLLAPVTPTTLTRQLRELERDGLVIRTHHKEIPPRVEYEVTDAAASLRPVLQTISEWVEANHNPETHTSPASATAS